MGLVVVSHIDRERITPHARGGLPLYNNPHKDDAISYPLKLELKRSRRGFDWMLSQLESRSSRRVELPCPTHKVHTTFQTTPFNPRIIWLDDGNQYQLLKHNTNRPGIWDHAEMREMARNSLLMLLGGDSLAFECVILMVQYVDHRLDYRRTSAECASW